MTWIDDLFSDMDERGIAGGACVIVQGDQVVHMQGYGVEDRETRKPVDPLKTRMYLASVTKAFTATLIFRLADRGLVDLEEDITSYLNENPPIRLLPGSKPVTLRHLLTHTAGFDDRNIGMAVASANEVEPLSSYLSRALPPQVRPAGEITMYDNHGWALAGLVAERVADQRYAELVRNEVLAPLGMQHSDTDIRDRAGRRVNFAAAYVTRYRNSERVWEKVSPSHRLTTPAGSIWATGSDMSRFLRAHLNLGELDGQTVLTKSFAQDMQASSWAPGLGAEGLTAGFWERSFNGRRVLMILGAAPEGASLVALVPSEGLGVFVAVSRKEASYLTSILESLLDRLTPGEAPAVTPNVLPGWEARARSLAGEYFLLRFSQRSLETLAKWQAWIEVTVVEPGRIKTVDSLGRTRVYREVTENVFRQDGKPGFIAFKTDPNGETHWATTTDGLGFGDGMGFPNSFEKAQWFERVRVKRLVLLLSLLVFSAAIVVWPLLRLAAWSMKLLRRGERSSGDAKSWGACLPWGVACFGLTGLLGVAMLLADQDQLVLGMPSWSLAPCWSLVLFVVLTPLCLWVTLRSWRHGKWTLLDRLFASVVAINAVVLTPFLWNWNLIALSF